MNKSISISKYSFLGKTFLAALMLFTVENATAQGRWSASAKIANQKDGISYSAGQLAKIHEPLQPAFTLDLQRNYLNTNRSRLYQSVYGTYFYQPYMNKSITLGTAIGYEFRIVRGLYLGVNLGGGINRTKPNDIVYNYENDKWVPARSEGPTAVGLQLQGGSELGYRVGKFSFFASGQYSYVAKYIDLPDFTFPFIHKNIGLGVRMGL
jgi:hypothetical protein